MGLILQIQILFMKLVRKHVACSTSWCHVHGCNNNSNGTSFENTRIWDIIVFNAFAADAVEEGKTIVSWVAAIFEKGETLRGNAELDQLCYPVSVPAVLEDKTIMTKGDANECSIPGGGYSNHIGKLYRKSSICNQ